jgi:hypothetical protein
MLNRMTTRVAIVLGAFVGAVSCNHPLGADMDITLTGFVTDGTYPLAGAEVVAQSPIGTSKSTTATDGKYKVKVGRGDVLLRAGMDGFMPQARQLSVRQDDQVDFELEWLHGSEGVPGLYTLTFTASPSCAYPAEAVRRTYIARIQEGHEFNRGDDLIVTVTGADFVGWANAYGFTGWRDGTTVHFDITDDFDAPFALIERLPDGTELHYSGSATGTVSDRTIVATFSGGLRLGSPWMHCQADDHRMEFVR